MHDILCQTPIKDDFHYTSLHNPVNGFVLMVNEGVFMRTLSIRFAEGKVPKPLHGLMKHWLGNFEFRKAFPF